MLEFRRYKNPRMFKGPNIQMSAFATADLFTDNDKAVTIPLLQLAQAYYNMFMPRVFRRGEAADGGDFGRFSSRMRRIWISNVRPQPPGFQFRTAKFAVYKTNLVYRQALGIRKPRFVESGRMARSFVIRAMSPTRVTIQPRGSRPTVGTEIASNRRLLRVIARQRGKSPVKPNPKEERAIADLVKELYPVALLTTAVHTGAAFGVRKKLRARQNALNRLKREGRKVLAQMQSEGVK